MRKAWNKKIVEPGCRYGKLTIIREMPSNNQRTMVECICDCGAVRTICLQSLERGLTKSCGCLRNNTYNFKHGQSNSKLYRIWNHIKNRCNNPHDPDYRNYGGRGISLCDEWSRFDEFYKWAINNGYCENLSIDRINNNNGYSPNNCRWTTRKIQGRNKRTNKLVTIDGRTKCIAEWAEEKNISYNKMYWQLRNEF